MGFIRPQHPPQPDRVNFECFLANSSRILTFFAGRRGYLAGTLALKHFRENDDKQCEYKSLLRRPSAQSLF